MKNQRRIKAEDVVPCMKLIDEEPRVPKTNLIGFAVRLVALRIPKAIIFLN